MTALAGNEYLDFLYALPESENIPLTDKQQCIERSSKFTVTSAKMGSNWTTGKCKWKGHLLVKHTSLLWTGVD